MILIYGMFTHFFIISEYMVLVVNIAQRIDCAHLNVYICKFCSDKYVRERRDDFLKDSERLIFNDEKIVMKWYYFVWKSPRGALQMAMFSSGIASLGFFVMKGLQNW